MSLYHHHKCANAAKGCEATFTCSAEFELMDSGPSGFIKVCVHEDEKLECEDCEASRCKECGAFPNLGEEHDKECPFSEFQKTSGISKCHECGGSASIEIVGETQDPDDGHVDYLALCHNCADRLEETERLR